jgi:hypothetical protein
VADLTLPQVFRDAKAIVERNGLHKGWFYDQSQREAGTPKTECRVCILGAVRAAVEPEGYAAASDLETAAIEILLGLVPDDGRQLVDGLWVDSDPIPDWNDKPERTAADVCALLDRAAAAAEDGAS